MLNLPIDFQTDFSVPDEFTFYLEGENGWSFYRDGKYVLLNSTQYDNIVMFGSTYGNSEVSVDIEMPYILNGSAGLACRVRPNFDGYYFLYSPEGYAMIFAIEEDSVKELLPIVNITPLPDPTKLRLTIRCVDDKLTMLINGELISEVVDDRYLNGLGAFVAVNGADADSTAAFDNLTVTVK